MTPWGPPGTPGHPGMGRRRPRPRPGTKLHVARADLDQVRQVGAPAPDARPAGAALPKPTATPGPGA